MNGELQRLTELGKLFDCTDAISATAQSVSTRMHEMRLAKDCWDGAAAALNEIQVSMLGSSHLGLVDCLTAPGVRPSFRGNA